MRLLKKKKNFGNIYRAQKCTKIDRSGGQIYQITIFSINGVH